MNLKASRTILNTKILCMTVRLPPTISNNELSITLGGLNRYFSPFREPNSGFAEQIHEKA